MKKLFIYLLLMFIGMAYSQHGQLIGKVINGKNVITENIDNIKKDWAKIMTDNHISGTIAKYEITSDSDSSYYLLGTTSDKSFKIARLLFLDASSYNFSLSDADNHTVSCNGCTIGCSPHYIKSVKLWECQLPCQGCSKSETVSN